MRLEATGKPDQYKVWLTDDELAELERAATSKRDYIIIRLGGRASRVRGSADLPEARQVDRRRRSLQAPSP